LQSQLSLPNVVSPPVKGHFVQQLLSRCLSKHFKTGITAVLMTYRPLSVRFLVSGYRLDMDSKCSNLYIPFKFFRSERASFRFSPPPRFLPWFDGGGSCDCDGSSYGESASDVGRLVFGASNSFRRFSMSFMNSRFLLNMRFFSSYRSFSFNKSD
jgi:hypothetical protein